MYVWKHLKHCHHIISIMRSHLEANCHIVILVTYHLPLFHLIFVFNRLCHIILPCHIISTLSPSYLLTLFLPSSFFATSPHFITSFHFFSMSSSYLIASSSHLGEYRHMIGQEKPGSICFLSLDQVKDTDVLVRKYTNHSSNVIVPKYGY